MIWLWMSTVFLITSSTSYTTPKFSPYAPFLPTAPSDKAPAIHKRQLVVFLLDGVRWDYVDLLNLRKNNSFFNEFLNEGVRASYVTTVFPSLSVPAWTSLQTGLYPESHGMLGNVLYDKHENLFFQINEKNWSSRWWQEAEPIWVTAMNQGLRVATLAWNSANVPYHGILPHIASGYQSPENKLTFEDRIERTVLWLRDGYDLIMIFYEGPDDVGHRIGAGSYGVLSEMETIGRGLKTLFQAINTSLEGDVQVMVVSDHGMSNQILPHISVSQYIQGVHLNPSKAPPVPVDNQDDDAYILGSWPSYYIYASPGWINTHVNSFKNIPGYEVKVRNDIPEDFHFKAGKWAPDVLIYPRMHDTDSKHWIHGGGSHGFDPFHRDMRTVLYAWGSAFGHRSYALPPLQLVDMYLLMCHALHVIPRPNNGSWERVRFYLEPSEAETPRSRTTFLSATDRAATLRSDPGSQLSIGGLGLICFYVVGTDE